MANKEIYIRLALALLIIVFLPLLILLIFPISVYFYGTSATTQELFFSVSTGNIFIDILYIIALKTPIEMFGYFSIVYGTTWYFLLTILIFGITWLIAGLITKRHILNFIIAIIGILYTISVITVSATTIPITCGVAYQIFQDGMILVRLILGTMDAIVTFGIYLLIALTMSSIGTVIAKSHTHIHDTI